MKKILFAVIVFMMTPQSFAQTNVGESANFEPTMIIDKPTAGMLHKGSYSVNTSFYQQGGVLFGVSVGLLDPFSFGISYGGAGIIGQDKAVMNPSPGVNVKLRLFEESTIIPAIAIGFDSQGKGPYVDSTKRYTIKSPGFYAVASQNYAVWGNLSLHGGVNFSAERDDGDKDANAFIGAEKSLGKEFSLLAEYDFGINDNNDSAIGQGKGYLNLGLRWSWGKGLIVGIDVKNITKNQTGVNLGNRTIYMEYVGSF